MNTAWINRFLPEAAYVNPNLKVGHKVTVKSNDEFNGRRGVVNAVKGSLADVTLEGDKPGNTFDHDELEVKEASDLQPGKMAKVITGDLSGKTGSVLSVQPHAVTLHIPGEGDNGRVTLDPRNLKSIN